MLEIFHGLRVEVFLQVVSALSEEEQSSTASVVRPGDTASQRGLPPGSERRPHTRYEAVKTIKGATIGTAAPVPSFDATGGGRQYTFGGRSIQDLVNAGHLREIS